MQQGPPPEPKPEASGKGGKAKAKGKGKAKASEEDASDADVEEADKEEEDDSDLELEEEVMSLIKEMDEDSGGKGVVWDEIVMKAEDLKLDEERLEEVINSLVNKGSLYVPSFGKYKIV